ncbi:MAG: metalloregulator ArsR/SmtB family transcription factor [Candidatus Thermoplasmatota archaeon]
METDPLELENRRAIYQLVARFPGIHLRDVQKRMELSMGVLEYHLNYMVKRGILSAQTDGYRRTYFVREEVQHPDKPTLALLRQEVPRRMIVYLLLGGKRGFKDLVEEIGMSRSTTSFHLKKLTESGLVRAERSGREMVYWIADPERTANLIITYKESFLDSVVDRFVDAWLKL